MYTRESAVPNSDKTFLTLGILLVLLSGSLLLTLPDTYQITVEELGSNTTISSHDDVQVVLGQDVSKRTDYHLKQHKLNRTPATIRTHTPPPTTIVTTYNSMYKVSWTKVANGGGILPHILLILGGLCILLSTFHLLWNAHTTET